jgi:hypothetical protein
MAINSNRNPARRKHSQYLEKMAARLCKYFGIRPDCFAVASQLLGRGGPNNTSAIYLWLNDHYGSEENWEEFIDYDECTRMLRQDLVKQIPDHYIGDILM